jgi:succinyl-CoA synthetase beta subunit
MKLYEYQVKELFRDAGIAIPKSTLIHHVDQASEAFRGDSVFPVSLNHKCSVADAEKPD